MAIVLQDIRTIQVNCGKLQNALGTSMPIYAQSPVNNIFHLDTALHEWYKPNYTDVGTTITEVDTGSIGGMNMANPDAASEPTLSANSIDFNGTTQYTRKLTSNFRSADTTGVVHVKANFTGDGTNQVFFGAGNTGTDLKWFIFRTIRVASNDLLEIFYRNSGTIEVKRTSTAVTNGTHVFSFASNGTSAHIWLDGVKETTYSADSLTNYWFSQSYAAGLVSDGISSSSILRPTVSYSATKQIYKCYEPYVNDAAVAANAIDILNNAA